MMAAKTWKGSTGRWHLVGAKNERTGNYLAVCEQDYVDHEGANDHIDPLDVEPNHRCKRCAKQWPETADAIAQLQCADGPISPADAIQQTHVVVDGLRRWLADNPTPITRGDVNDTTASLLMARRALDNAAGALLHHLGGSSRDKQAAITGGWVLYDPDLARTWPPMLTPLAVRQLDAYTGHEIARAPGKYEGCHLKWKVPQTLDMFVNVLSSPHHAYAWRPNR